MAKYSVTTPDRLRQVCIRQHWFTKGTNDQYERLFRLNDEGKPTIVIAGVIWMCSDEEDLPLIRGVLEEERRRYLEQCGNPEKLFALCLSITEEKQFVVKAPDLEAAKAKLVDAYNCGKVELFTGLAESHVQAYPDTCNQAYIEAAGTDEFEVIE